jgi:MarR family 2-MHQ and catechol resistance regulon transcriptional repressor
MPQDKEDDLALMGPAAGKDLDALVVYNLLRTHSYLSPFVDAGLRRDKLTAAQFNTLLAIQSAGPVGLRMGEIGKQLVVTRSNVTGLVDRLEREGLVARVEGQDRRTTSVRLTPRGERALERAIPPHSDRISKLTDCLAKTEKQTLIRLLTKLRRELRKRRGAKQ